MKAVSIPFNRATLVGNELDYINKAIERGKISGDGHFTLLCNERITELTLAAKVLLTHSCTAALEMAAILCDLNEGDEVIMPSFTFVSTANAVALCGAVPVFVDIDSLTLNIDPEKVKPAISSRTKAIFVVHYAGFAADMDALTKIAKAHDLVLVEDAAQAFGSSYKGKPCGSLGDLAAFSFHETKNIVSGEGGALTINRPEFFERAEVIREKGTNRPKFLRGEVDEYTWVDIGSSFLPGELVAAFLYAQLENAKKIIEERLTLFRRYIAGFSDLESFGRLKVPHSSVYAQGNGHIFYLLLRDREDRDSFIAHMRAHGIITPFHYVPLHSSPAGLRYGRASGTLPVTTDISARLVRLPLFFSLGKEIEAVIQTAREFLLR